MSAIRSVFVALWLLTSYGLGFFASLFRFGNPSNNQITFKLFSVGARFLAGWKVEWENIEHLKTAPVVIVLNHQSGMDMAVFGKHFVPHCALIAKRSLAWIPFLGWSFLSSGTILIDRKNRISATESLKDGVRRIKEERISVGIFPEGTRNKNVNGFLPFKKGAFHLAIQAQVPLLPIVAQSYRNVGVLERLSLKPGFVRVRVLEPEPTAGLTHADLDSLLERVRARMKVAYDEISR
jgi:lysophosphatidate acyltransferase